ALLACPDRLSGGPLLGRSAAGGGRLAAAAIAGSTRRRRQGGNRRSVADVGRLLRARDSAPRPWARLRGDHPEELADGGRRLSRGARMDVDQRAPRRPGWRSVRASPPPGAGRHELGGGAALALALSRRSFLSLARSRIRRGSVAR